MAGSTDMLTRKRGIFLGSHPDTKNYRERTLGRDSASARDEFLAQCSVVSLETIYTP